MSSVQQINRVYTLHRISRVPTKYVKKKMLPGLGVFFVHVS